VLAYEPVAGSTGVRKTMAWVQFMKWMLSIFEPSVHVFVFANSKATEHSSNFISVMAVAKLFSILTEPLNIVKPETALYFDTV
jgi:hypothetical protein